MAFFFSSRVYFHLIDDEVVLAVPERRPVVPHQLDEGQGEDLLRLVPGCRQQRRERESSHVSLRQSCFTGLLLLLPKCIPVKAFDKHSANNV